MIISYFSYNLNVLHTLELIYLTVISVPSFNINNSWIMTYLNSINFYNRQINNTSKI